MSPKVSSPHQEVESVVRACRFLTLCTLMCFVLTDCTSYYALTQEELDKGSIPSESPIRVTRKDGSIVESGAFLHAFVKDSLDFIIGTGSDRRSGKPFAGAVPRTEIDSARRIQAKDSQGDDQTYFLFYLKNRTSLAFTEHEHLNITPHLQPGLWCAGTVTDGITTRLAKGRIDSSTIEKIEAKRLIVFNPSLPFSHEGSEQGFQWFNAGVGPLEADREGDLGMRDMGSFLLRYSVLSKGSLYSARFISTFGGLPLPVYQEGTGPRFSVYELGALYGIAYKSSFLTASASAGISYVGGLYDVSLRPSPGYRTSKISTASFPIDLELALTPLAPIAIALTYYATFNSPMPFTGFAFCLQFLGEM